MLKPFEELHELSRVVTIEPHLMHCNKLRLIKDKVWRSVRKVCTKEIGFVMRLEDIIDIGEGFIHDFNGSIQYRVKFSVTTFKPKKGDTVLAQVSEITSMGIYAELGPLEIFIPSINIPKHFKYVHPNNSESGEAKYVSSKTEDEIKIANIISIKLRIVRKMVIDIDEEEDEERDEDEEKQGWSNEIGNYDYVGGMLKAIGIIEK